jgi:AcrR family transcriptional regulator
MPRPPRCSDELTSAQKKIIEAALDAFAERGFHGTATKEIALRAGVAEATIFKYFPSKKGLLISVLEPAMEHLLAPAMARSMGPLLDAPHSERTSGVGPAGVMQAITLCVVYARLPLIRAGA